MIRLDRLKRQPEMRIEKLPVGGAIEVLTCKRNRGITIRKEPMVCFWCVSTAITRKFTRR